MVAFALALGLLGAPCAGGAQESISALISSAAGSTEAPPLPPSLRYVPGELIVKLRAGVLGIDPVGPREQTAVAIASSSLGNAAQRAFQARLHRYQATFVRRLGDPPADSRHGSRSVATVRDAQERRFRSAQQRFPLRATRASPDAHAPDLSGVYLVELSKATSVLAAAEDLASDPHVEFAHPNYRLELLATPLPNVPYVPADEFVTRDGAYWREASWGQAYPDLWRLERIQAFEAWNLFPDPSSDPGRRIVIAIVDTGLDVTHPDVAANVWVNRGEDLNGNDRVDGTNTCPIPSGDFNCIDDDGNGYVDDLHGWDFVAGTGDPRDGYGHGTHCAGIIAALANGGAGASGIVGVAPNARIMPLKVLDDMGSFGGCAAAFEAIVYLANEGADVDSNSWGGYVGECPEIEDALAYATSLGVVVVAAAGNAAANVALFTPAAFPGSIAVGASNQDDGLTAFSNRGAGIDVVAPGGGLPDAEPAAQRNILSLLATSSVFAQQSDFEPLHVGSGLIRLAGTSMAAPHVAAAAAVLLSGRRELTVEQVRQALRAAADDVAQAGWDEETGFGRLNLRRAMALPPLPTAQILNLTGEAHLFGTVPVGLDIAAGQRPIRSWLLTSQPADGSAAPVTIARGDGADPAVFTVDWDLASIPRDSYLIRLEVEDGDGQMGVDVHKVQRSLYEALPQATLPSTRWAAFAISSGDVDGDGDVDLFPCNAAGSPDDPLDVRQQLWTNDGAGTFSDHAEQLPETADGLCVDSEIADFNRDGALDLFILKGNGANGHRLLINDGGGTFADETATRLPVLQPSGLAFHGSAAGDVDGDGDIDIVVADPTALLINDGTGAFTDQLAARMPWLAPCSHAGICSMSLSDVDRDGDLDLVYHSGVGINDGGGIFAMGRGTLAAEYLGLGDIDGDALPDVVLSGASAAAVKVKALLNDGAGGFPEPPIVLVSGAAGVPHLVDLDQDCDLDLLVSGETLMKPLQAFLNDGRGRFTVAPGEQFLHPFAAASTAVVDVDGGYDEVVVAGVWDQSVILKARWDEFPLCGGDCDGDGTVDIAELTRLVDIALGTDPLCRCRPGDSTPDARITIAEIVGAVVNSLASCGGFSTTVRGGW